MIKKHSAPHHREKQLLQYQVKALKKNLSGSLPGPPRDGKADDILASGTILGKRKRLDTGNDKRTIYEKYRRMWRQDVNDIEKKIFEEENNEEEEDPFFLDPTDEKDAKLLEKNKKEVEIELKKNRQFRHNKSGYKPYEERGFRGGGKDFKIKQKPKKQIEVPHGKESATPSYSEMKHIDPASWKDNVNFQPIPASKNKMEKLKLKK